jgi:hypothetical protein
MLLFQLLFYTDDPVRRSISEMFNIKKGVHQYLCLQIWHYTVKFEVFTAVTMKNVVFWDVMQHALVASYSYCCS